MKYFPSRFLFTLFLFAISICSAKAEELAFVTFLNDVITPVEIKKDLTRDELVELTFTTGYKVTVYTEIKNQEQIYYFKCEDQPLMEVRNDVGQSGTYMFRDLKDNVYQIKASIKQ
jgi:hypothetical protein